MGNVLSLEHHSVAIVDHGSDDGVAVDGQRVDLRWVVVADERARNGHTGIIVVVVKIIAGDGRWVPGGDLPYDRHSQNLVLDVFAVIFADNPDAARHILRAADEAFLDELVQVVVDHRGRVDFDCRADLPNGRRVAVLIRKLLDELEDSALALRKRLKIHKLTPNFYRPYVRMIWAL